MYAVATDAGSRCLALLEACEAAVRSGPGDVCPFFVAAGGAAKEAAENAMAAVTAIMVIVFMSRLSQTDGLVAVGDHARRIREHNLIKINLPNGTPTSSASRRIGMPRDSQATDHLYVNGDETVMAAASTC